MPPGFLPVVNKLRLKLVIYSIQLVQKTSKEKDKHKVVMVVGVVVSVLDYRSDDPSSSLACHDIFQYNCTVLRKDKNK